VLSFAKWAEEREREREGEREAGLLPLVTLSFISLSSPKI